MLRNEKVIEALAKNEYLGIFTFDKDFQIKNWSTKMEQLFGLPAGKVLNHNLLALLSNAKPNLSISVLEKLLQSRKINIKNGEYSLNGTSDVINFEASLAPVYNETQELQGGIGMVWDVTENRHHQQILWESEHRFQNLADHAPVLIWLMSPNSRASYFNQTWLDFTGKDLMNELGLGWLRNVHADDVAYCLSYYALANEQKTEFEIEFRLLRHDGVYRWMLAKGVPRWLDNGHFVGYMGSCIDISDMRRLSEAKLEASENLLNNLISGVETPITALDLDFNFLLSNQAHDALLKQLFEIEVGVGDNYIAKLSHLPKAQQHQQSIWQRALGGEKFTILEKIDNPILPHPRYYEVSYAPLLNKQQVQVGATAISRDVTEKKIQENRIAELLEIQTNLIEGLERQNKELAMQEEEIRQANEELLRTNNRLSFERQRLVKIARQLQERNFELDQIMYKTSHDIRSPIASVLGLLNIIKEETNTEKIREYLNFIEKRTLNLDYFTRSMLNYGKSQRGDLDVQVVDFQCIINQSFSNLQFLPTFDRLQKTVAIEGDTQAFYSDEFRLLVVFGNIISNAIKYQKNLDKRSFLKIHIQITPQNATITFKDNGIGISEEHLNRVFDMFYRATDKSDGSGLGMYIVKQTIKKLKGKIRLKSRLNRGTILTIVLPNLLEKAKSL
jgi:PAS domain S-box-containing protein